MQARANRLRRLWNRGSMKAIAWIILSLTFLLFFALIYYLVVGAILFKLFFSRKNLQEKIFRKKISSKDVDLTWWNKFKIERLVTNADDNTKLVGYYLDFESDKTAILVPGFDGWQNLQLYAKLFKEIGFNILAVECRWQGDSEGKEFCLKDGQDVLCWINFLNKKNPNNKILLFGLSSGGTAVCCATGQNLPPNVLCAISDSAFANIKGQIEYFISKHKPALKMFEKHLYSFTDRVNEFDLNKANACECIKKSNLPIFIIHGENDEFVLLQNAKILFERAPQNMKEIYIVANAGHCGAYMTAGKNYEKKILNFIKSRTKF